MLAADGQARLAQRALVSALAQGEVADSQAAAEVADLAVPKLDEMADRPVRRTLVGEHDGLHEVVVAGSVKHYEGDLGVGKQVVVLLEHLGAEQDDATVGVTQQCIDLLPAGALVGELEGDVGGGQAVLARLVLDAIDDGEAERPLVDHAPGLAVDGELDAAELAGASMCMPPDAHGVTWLCLGSEWRGGVSE